MPMDASKNSNAVKYLGVQLSRSLDGRDQAGTFDSSMLKLLTSGLIQPYLDYCTLLYDGKISFMTP